jgi:hypothetical protein
LRRFPIRTLVLMGLALIVFARMWYVTHKEEQQPSELSSARAPGMAVDVISPNTAAPGQQPPAPPSPACATLERAIGPVVIRPADSAAISAARQQLEACAQTPARACELGPALDVRAPLSTPPSPARELLGELCKRCPAEKNPCGELVSRVLQEGVPGRTVQPAEARWNLEHAGAGTAAACATLVREALAPAAISGGDLKPTHPALLTELAPVCAKAGHLPVALVNAAIMQRGAQAGDLAKVAEGGPVYTKPSEVTGPEGAAQAFDGSDKKGVELTPAPGPRQESDGALRARFDPPLKRLTALRVMVKGAGTLRAIVRAPQGVGLKDEQRGLYFVNPTVCQFQGIGQWELCALGLPLLDVEAITVVPSDPKITVLEVDVQGTR